MRRHASMHHFVLFMQIHAGILYFPSICILFIDL
jgi:hypothetical protein